MVAAAHPRPAPHEQVSLEAGATGASPGEDGGRGVSEEGECAHWKEN